MGTKMDGEQKMACWIVLIIVAFFTVVMFISCGTPELRCIGKVQTSQMVECLQNIQRTK